MNLIFVEKMKKSTLKLERIKRMAASANDASNIEIIE